VLVPEQITTRELADYWGVTYLVVWHAANSGHIPGCTKGSKGFVFDKEVAIAGWVPSKLKKWAKDFSTSVTLIAGESGLTVEEGRKGLQNAAIARLHDLHVLVSSEDWANIVLGAVSKASEGDWRARKWLGDYLIGPPVQRVEAEVEITTQKIFSDELRAQAIEALLQSVRDRVTIDVEPNEPKSDAN
jgi:hypothetical protein